MLWADPFTLSALDTVHSLAKIHGISLIVHIRLFTGGGIHIIQSKTGRNTDILRTFFHTVSAVCAWRDITIHNISIASTHFFVT